MAPAKKVGNKEDSAISNAFSPHTGKFQVNRTASQQKKETREAKEARVMTGIEGLDEVMGGGFEKKSVNIVCGGPGSGKSIFALQFLANGASKFNEPGVYITFEESKEKILKHTEEFGWDLKKLEDEGKIAIIEYTPSRVKKLLAEGGGEVDLTVGKLKAKRLVLDSLTAFALLFNDELARIEAFLDLFRLIQSWGCTALLIAEDEQDPDKHKPSAMEFEVDGVVLLYNIRKGDIRERALEILKLRGTSHSAKIFPMKISDGGITVFPEETVF